jgi:hypothetical protein
MPSCNLVISVLSFLALLSTTPSVAAVDFTTLQGKVLVGYQGWFNCPTNGSGTWTHWSRGEPNPNSLSVDLYPDLSEFDPQDLCLAKGMTIDEKPAYLYSSFTSAIVNAHFRWMAEYGLDGVLVQRFLKEAGWKRNTGDVVLKNIIAAAQTYGRTFAIEYDITDSDDGNYAQVLKDDWIYLTDVLHITAFPNYLRHNGKPVISVWGPGLNDRIPTNPEIFKTFINWFQNGPEQYRAIYMGGTPARWRTLDLDSRGGIGWENAYKAMNVIQPWTVDRYKDTIDVMAWDRDILSGDVSRTKADGNLYMPVVFPGFSCKNLGLCRPNQVPRMGGKFLWSQAYGAKAAGATMLKIAMFDETDEGSAIFKIVSKRRQAPEQGFWLALDADGFDLPSDWYLRLAGEITRMFHGEIPATPKMPIDPDNPFVGTHKALGPPQSSTQGRLAYFRAAGGIQFQPKTGTIAIQIFSANGKAFRMLKVGSRGAFWNLGDEANSPIKAGIYLAREIGNALRGATPIFGDACIVPIP